MSKFSQRGFRSDVDSLFGMLRSSQYKRNMEEEGGALEKKVAEFGGDTDSASVRSVLQQ